MLEPVRQALGALGGLLRDTCGHGSRDGEEVGLDSWPDASRTVPEQPIQAPDGPLQAHDRIALVLLAPCLEVDDDSHARIVDRGSDISVKGSGRLPDSPVHVTYL
jgi:hypothetical protein